MLFTTLVPNSLIPVVVTQPDEKHANRVVCWSIMTDTEHSTTSSSNEEDLHNYLRCLALCRGDGHRLVTKSISKMKGQ